jgi:hypothetical protein
MPQRSRWVIWPAMALLVPALAGAQEAPAMSKQQGDSIPTLKLAADPRVGHGSVAAVHGTVGPEGLRFAVGELSILQPIMVMLLARDEADDLSVALFKKDWTTGRRSATTRGSGMASLEFRTQGGVNIQIRSAAAGTPFALVVWAGTELHPTMPDVVVSYDEFRKLHPDKSVTLNSGPSATGGRGASVPVWILLVIVGVGAAGFVALRTLGRRKAA